MLIMDLCAHLISAICLHASHEEKQLISLLISCTELTYLSQTISWAVSVELMRFAMQSVEFSVNSIKQIYGTAMGSSFGPVLANIFV